MEKFCQRRWRDSLVHSERKRLQANLVEDISCTRLIDGVMVQGHMYTRADLDVQLEEVVMANQER